MANICFTKLTLHGEPIAVERVLAVACGQDIVQIELEEQCYVACGDGWSAWSFHSVVPQPQQFGITDTPEAQQLAVAFNGRRGSTETAYDWRCHFWGTKAGGDAQAIARPDAPVTLDCTTAWCPAIPVIRALSARVPDVAIDAFCEEAGNGVLFKQVWHAGRLLGKWDGKFPENMDNGSLAYRNFARREVRKAITSTGTRRKRSRQPPDIFKAIAGQLPWSPALIGEAGSQYAGWNATEFAAWKSHTTALSVLLPDDKTPDWPNLIRLAYNGARMRSHVGNKFSWPALNSTLGVIADTMISRGATMHSRISLELHELFKGRVTPEVTRKLVQCTRQDSKDPYRDVNWVTALASSAERNLMVAASQAGVDINARGPREYSSMVIAALLDITGELTWCNWRDAGGDIGGRDAKGLSVSDHLLRAGRFETLEQVLKLGAPFDFRFPCVNPRDKSSELQSFDDFFAKCSPPPSLWAVIQSLRTRATLMSIKPTAKRPRRSCNGL